jgi:hypothetical protein
MAVSWPTSRQDVAKMAHMEPKMGILSALLKDLGDFFWILERILPKLAKTRKTTTVHHFSRFSGILGELLEAMLAHLAVVWAMLDHLGAKFSHLGRSCPQVATFLARRREKDTEDEVR